MISLISAVAAVSLSAVEAFTAGAFLGSALHIASRSKGNVRNPSPKRSNEEHDED